MSQAASDKLEARILVLFPTRPDAAMCQTVLRQAGLEGVLCGDLHQLCREFEAGGAAAMVLTEEALAAREAGEFVGMLACQPPWSDIPVVVLMQGGVASPAVAPVLERMDNVVLLPRPIQVNALMSAVRSAVRARRRQYQVREHLAERKRAEEALRRSEAGLAQAVRVAGLGTFEHDQVADTIECSPLLREIYGWGQDERVTLPGILERVAPEDQERVAAAIRQAHDPAGTGMYEIEHRVAAPDGRIRWVSVRSRTFFEGEGSRRRAVRTIGAVLEITERRRAEEVLRESESRFRALFEYSPEAVFLTVPDGRIEAANPGACAMFGMTEEEICRAGRVGLLEAGDPGQAPALEERRRTGRVVGVELGYVRKNGEKFIGATTSVVLPGSPARAFVIVRDVTARKQAEERLRESEERLRLANKASNDVVWDWDIVNDRQQWNEAGAVVFGWTEIVEHSGSAAWWVERVHPDDRHRVEKDFFAVVNNSEANCWHDEYRFQKADGSYAEVMDRGYVLRDKAGKAVRMIGAMLDITERRRAEEAVRRSETLLAQAVRVAGLGIFEHDHRPDIIKYSPLMRELMGFGKEEPLTIPVIVEHVVPEDREGLAGAIRGAHDPAGDGLFEVEFRVPGADGRIRWMSARSQTFFEGAGAERRPVRTIGAALDVTERKNAQAELERLVAERTGKLQELVGELEHFSYTITHDMRAPLRAMMGYAELMGKAGSSCRERDGGRFLELIKASASRMDALITDALQYSKAVRQELEVAPVDAGALLRGMLDSYPELQPSKARIKLKGEMPRVMGNAAGLTQCFSNLLGNAVKFAKPGEMPEVMVWAEVREDAETRRHGDAERELRWVRIWVEDKGIGIPGSMLPRVFDMFSRGHTEYEGTGIGLALVRKVVDRMGGRVGVESEEGKGSRFWIELKLGEFRPRVERSGTRPAEAKGGRVLYVEDEQSDAMFMGMAFAEKGMESALRVVGDGRMAIEYLSGAGKYADRQEYPLPSVVLLDLNLPQVSGFEVLKWMRNNPDFARTPVVVFSSSTREDDRVKALELGANEFVGKPSSGLKFGEVVEGLRERWMGQVQSGAWGGAAG